MRDLPPNMTDYLATRASFRLEVPERYNYARDVVDAWAAREPGKLALLAVGPDGGDARRFSFADLAAASDRAARFLAGQGVAKGDRVFVMLPRVPDWYDVVLGCIKLGAVPMPATTLLTPRDIAYRLNSAEASVVVVDAEGTTKVDQVAADCPSLRTRVYLAGGGFGGIPDEAPGQAGGWVSWADGLAAAGDGPPEVEPTRSDDPMLLYFTSGTVAYATVGFPRTRTTPWTCANASLPIGRAAPRSMRVWRVSGGPCGRALQSRARAAQRGGSCPRSSWVAPRRRRSPAGTCTAP
jgi:non-ribosomal peptide synthetase component F